MTTEPDGSDLLARAAAGDRGAFEAFVRRWEGPLFRFLARTTGSADLADEARQLTFVRVLRRADSFRGGSVSSWLFKTASRIAIDLHRSETRRTAASLADDAPLAGNAPDPAEAAADGDERDRVRAALAAMDAHDRALLWLRVAEERTFADVAGTLGIPEATARLRFVRALGRLRRRLRPGMSARVTNGV